jgi:hypothetical protein
MVQGSMEGRRDLEFGIENLKLTAIIKKRKNKKL